MGWRQRPPSILWFGGSCLSIVVLNTSLIGVYFVREGRKEGTVDTVVIS